MDNYIRKIKILHVVDGDTVDVEIDLGFRTSMTQRIRLLNVDTPELTSKDPVIRQKAVDAMNFVKEWTAAPGDYYMQSFKSDSFGRWLGIIWRNSLNEELNQTLLYNGLAVPFVK